ncbi:MAG TPA: hypothetical protein VFZ65_22675 [Planctomycetota bacterium]|nr:hypothetical protein [Planctomycetota bacterium]
MKAYLTILASIALLSSAAFAQTGAQLKQELRTKEAAAKKDPDALFEVAKWASEKALAADAKRLYQSVVKLKPDHEGANLALGNALVEGKWWPAKEAEALRKKAMAAEYTAKGYVEVSGIWVEKDQVADAKRGVFHHENQLVTKDEKIALQAGQVRHPETGELIDPQFLEKASNKYFPIGSEGRWVDEKEADTYHSDIKRPWIVRSTYCTILSTLPLAKVQEMRQHADQGFERVRPLLGSVELSPANRPVILVAATESEYRDYGAALGDGTDAAGSFLMREEATLKVPFQGEVRACVCEMHKDWGPRYVRHAAALGYAFGASLEVGADLPLWLLHGFGSYTSRFDNDQDAAWFGQQHVQKGGVKNLKAFFAGFALNGEMEAKDVAYNLFQAGLMLSFAAQGGDAKTTEALQAVTASLSPGAKKGSAAKAISKLEAALIEAEPKIVAYLQKLIDKAR